MLLRGCGSAGLGTALVPPPVLLAGTVARCHSRVRETSLWWPAGCFPLELTGGLGSPKCPPGLPAAEGSRHTLGMAGGGREETPTLLSSQSCAHFAAGSGQCQHLWCCHRPGMPLSHPGRSRRGGGWADYLILEPAPASRGWLSWAPQGQCARPCPAVVTSRSCSGARPAQGLWSCLLACSRCPQPCTMVCVVLGCVQVPGEPLSPKLCKGHTCSFQSSPSSFPRCWRAWHQGHGGPWEGKMDTSRSVGSQHQSVPKGPLHCCGPWSWRGSSCGGAPTGILGMLLAADVTAGPLWCHKAVVVTKPPSGLA